MSIPRAFFKASVALALTFVTFFTASASGQSPADTASTSAQPAAAATPPTNNDRYRDGIIIWETPADAQVPFLLKFNVNTQIRYLNTQNSDEAFTDHLSVSREVHTRNDRYASPCFEQRLVGTAGTVRGTRQIT